MKAHLHIKLDKELLEAFDKQTKEEAINKSALVRKWIKEYLAILNTR